MKKLFFTLAIIGAFAAQASILERPMGIRIGQRMTIRPYVALYYTWDSNVDSSNSQGSYSSFNIMPGLTFTYKAENWSIEGGAYYQYHAYTKNSGQLNQNSWGENLAFNWSNSKDGGRGWSLVLRESFQQISQDDDMTNDGGRGIGRDRWQLQVAGTLQRRFTDRWHGDLDASYYYLDYKNNDNKYAPLYGWQRWTVGAQAGFVASKWTDILLMGNYQGYKQNNCENLTGYPQQPGTKKIGNNSQGWTAHLGIGTYATERISYRISGGYSQFYYGEGAAKMGGFTYALSGHWRMADRWNMMLLASSYYAPSEIDYASLTRTDTISWGIAHSMIRNKLTATLDLTYRHEKREFVDTGTSTTGNYNDDIITARLGLNYSLNRFLAVFGNCEYQRSFYPDQNTYDYARWRLSVGLRLTY